MENPNYASLNKRIYGYIIDQILFSILYIILVLLVNILVSSVYLNGFICIIILGLLELAILIKFDGQSIGKRIMNTRIVDEKTFGPVSVKNLAKRVFIFRPLVNIIGLVINLGAAYNLISLICIQNSYNSQAIWDKFANTVVIDEGSK